MKNILIVDDHPMVRTGLRALLSEHYDSADMGEAASGAQTLELLRSREWDLLLLDINLPDRSGMEILQEVRAHHPAVKVLVMSVLPERQYALNVIKAGANGYLPKECAPKELLEVVRAILQGRRYVTAETTERLITDMDKDSNEPLHERLSGRELQIFRKIATGRTVTSIGDELSLSVKTVSTYRTRILEER